VYLGAKRRYINTLPFLFLSVRYECAVQSLTGGDVGQAVGVEDLDVAGGEAVSAQHRVDAAGVVRVPASTRPVVPAARHDDGAVADLEQPTPTGGATQRRMRRLAASRVLADRVARRRPARGGLRPAGRRRTRRREAGDVGAAREQLAAGDFRRRRPATVTAASRSIFVVEILVDGGGDDQRDEVDLASTVEVASTTATIDGVPAAPLRGQHHAVTVPLQHNTVYV